MGTVYRARDVALNRPVALKVIRSGMDTAEQRKRFQAEARAAAKLNHPHVAQVYAVGEWQPAGGGPPMPYLAMELVEGGSLEGRLWSLRGGAVPAADAARLVALLARAVHHAHQRGLVHRDLKPGNVLLAAASDEPALNC
jgi:serine/threonine protein kinase